VARARSVTVEFKYLDPRSDKAATAIGVELFDGQFVIVDRAGIDERGPGSYAWYGKVRGYGHSDAILTVVDGQIAGSIVVADEATRTTQTYRILSITAVRRHCSSSILPDFRRTILPIPGACPLRCEPCGRRGPQCSMRMR
jgi:hypothetical protein